MTEIIRGLFNNTGARVSREWADSSNTNCLSASLVEVGVELGAGSPVFDVKQFGRDIGETERGTTPPSEVLEVVRRGADTLGMEVARVTVHPSFLEHCKVPEGMENLIDQATGARQISRPHIRIMAKEAGDTWHTHAETDTDSITSRERIGELENDGWISVMVVQFTKRG